jgi:hypothetical protein
VQLRLDENCCWHPFIRVMGDWQLAGRGDEDPATALSAVAGPVLTAEV